MSTGTTKGYTKSRYVPLEIVTSNADDYYVTETKLSTDKSSWGWTALSSLVNLGTLDATLSGKFGFRYDLFTMGSGAQGPHNIYMMYRDDTTPERNYTPFKVGSTFMIRMLRFR